MLNNFIGGGQVFLHKVRMFRQVLRATVVVSAIAGMLMAWTMYDNKHNKLDLDGAYTYWLCCMNSIFGILPLTPKYWFKRYA